MVPRGVLNFSKIISGLSFKFCCSGDNLFLIIDKYFFSFSIPIEFLPNMLATAEVVPEPTNGSKTVSPSSVQDKIILFSSSSGF